MSHRSHIRKGHARRHERPEVQDQLCGSTLRRHKKHGNTESLGETEGYDFESTTLDTVSGDEESIHSRKFREVFAETEEYPQSVADQVEQARSQNLVQLHCTARMDGFHQDITHNVEFP